MEKLKKAAFSGPKRERGKTGQIDLKRDRFEGEMAKDGAIEKQRIGVGGSVCACMRVCVRECVRECVQVCV